MADEMDDDMPMSDREVSEASSGVGNDSESEEEQLDWLATSREKRSTAGNRLSVLLQEEEPDDELELLFAEADDDVAFEDSEDGSDAQMDTSDDDEDQGPVVGAEDLEGEVELQRQAKADRMAKKRKLNGGIPRVVKRVKIDPTAIQEAKPRPKKKSERASWLPTTEEAPTRSSQRGSTKQQKQALYAQMVGREVKRLEQMKKMEKSAAAKAAMRKPPMTQAERMAEAAKVEKKNAKSLTKWEQAEKDRETERMAKLDALHNRRLEGPVITWWSGMADWIGGNLKKVGKILTLDDPREKPRKRKAAEMEADTEASSMLEGATPADSSKAVPSTPLMPSPEPQVPASSNPATPMDPGPNSKGVTTHEALANNPITPSPSLADSAPAREPTPPPYVAPLPNPPRAAGPLQPPAHLAHLLPGQSPYPHVPLPSISSPTPASSPMPPPPQPRPQSSMADINPLTAPPAHFPSPPPLPAPPVIEHATKNYVILQNFDETAIKSKDVQTRVLMNQTFHKTSKPKHTPLCVITSYPAKFREPSTGLPYFNSFAFKEIQKLKRGEYRWSKLLGAYVGQAGYAARGVPSRFLGIVEKKKD